ncbi:YetF domain-containing protein [Paenibacillus solisilvae]|uniref:YetF domain-containing protein n=1 Tax=Paenibacillus solisilvae TaxID=2486751 RepID=A0ABW0W0G1_9BACL
MDYTMITVKLVTAFFGLWLMTKLLGKKEISQLTPFDFISSLMLSELVGNTIYDREVHFMMLIYALVLWMVLSLALEKIVQLLPWLSVPLSGRPDIIIRNGVIDVRAMKRNKLDMHQVGMLLREQSVFSVKDVAYAIFETNGNLSVMKMSSADSPNREELKLPVKPLGLPRILMDQGYIQRDELREIGHDEEWLLALLKEQGIMRFKDVLYAEWSETDGLYVQRK